MKKVLALVLILAMILSVQAMAFAASPTGEPSSENVPVVVVDQDEDEDEVIAIDDDVTVVEEEELTEEQEAAADEAMKNAKEEGYQPVKTIIVEVSEEVSKDNPAKVSVTIQPTQVILVYDADGNLIEVLTFDQLKEMENILLVTQDVVIVIAEAK